MVCPFLCSLTTIFVLSQQSPSADAEGSVVFLTRYKAGCHISLMGTQFLCSLNSGALTSPSSQVFWWHCARLAPPADGLTMKGTVRSSEETVIASNCVAVPTQPHFFWTDFIFPQLRNGKYTNDYA